MGNNIRIRLLSDDDVGIMYEKCVEYLSSKGIKIIEHPEALKLLDQEGAQVDFDSGQVRFSKDVIEEALSKVPRSFTLKGRNGFDMRLPHPEGSFYVRSVSGVIDYFDPESNSFRSPTKADVAEWAQLIETLNEIDICLYLSASDVPQQTADIHGLKTILENTSKHIWVQPFDFGNIEYLFHLAQAVAGGAGNLKENPIISIWPTPLTPFCLKSMDAEVIIQGCRYGVPLIPAPLPSTGATSPMTIAGTVLQSGIEILAIIVMSQLLAPGHPVVALPVNFTTDMASGRALCGNVETALCSTASTEFIREAFHIPTATWAFGTDSYLADAHCSIEKTLSALMIAEGGCDILCGAGFLDVGKTCSPVQLIIDNELTSIIKRGISGVEVSDETLAWQELLDIEPGGNYMEHPHTLQHCRDALQTKLFRSQSKDTWIAEGKKDLYARALDEYKNLKKHFKPVEYAPEVNRELENIVKQADKDLANG